MAFAFYEKGEELLPLPHPNIPTSIFLIVEQALCAAWELLRIHPNPGFDLLSSTEDVITYELYKRLYNDIFRQSVVKGFDPQLFTVVTREAKVSSFDETHLDKMPDLLVGLVDRNVFDSTQDWLFIECKPVDRDHPAGAHYCDRGIVRFVNGEYAWTMTSALMIGYCRNGYSISTKLVDALKVRTKDIPTITFPSLCQYSKPGKYNETVQVSLQSRTFKYVETGKQAPEIELRHLWLRRD